MISKNALITFYEGVLEDVNIITLFCGVCKVNAAIATQILIDKYNVDFIIVSGTAGGMDNRLKVGDSVISTEVLYHDVAEEILTEYHPWMPSVCFQADRNLLELCKNSLETYKFVQKIYFGKIVTGETFINKDGRSEINQKYNPLCVDMETASIAHVCYANSLPFIAIRSISDTEERSGVESFEENCDTASANSFEVVKLLLCQMKLNTAV